MKTGKQLKDPAGNDIPFTCDNWKYHTNVAKGKKHAPTSNHKGAVTKIYDDGYSALFLEHVFEKKKPKNEIYWLMWYYPNGKPCIGESAVFGKKDIEKMIRSITTIKL